MSVDDDRSPRIGPGTLLDGRYRLVEPLGGGAMGTVWLAHDDALDRTVAVKQVVAGVDEADREARRERALREGRIAARLDNVHATAVYDVVTHDADPWLVMEHLPSRDLASVIRAEQVLPVAQVAQVGAQVADAMADAHALGIVHRDIKPSNILVGEGGRDDGVVKIADFGIAQADGEASADAPSTVSGTPAYFAPECARGRPATAPSDVFSLGSTLYACLEGVPPFGVDPDSWTMLRRVAAGRFEPPTRAGDVEPVLLRMLAPDPADRPTMAEVRDELAAVAAGRRGAVADVLAERTELAPLSRAAAPLAALVVAGAAARAAGDLVDGAGAASGG
ncbi:serine/threonine-protein kinase, partial [Rhodococcus aerolatus]